MLFFNKIYNPIKKINKNSFIKLDYYREELNEYSPLINAKILGKDIFDEDVIVSMLLYLNDKTLDNDISKLLSHELEFIGKKNFIFYDLKNHKKTQYKNTTIKRHLEDLIEEDMKHLGLIENKYKENTGFIKGVDVSTFILFLVNIFCLGIMTKNSIHQVQPIGKIIYVFEIFVNLMWIIIYYINTSLNLTFKMSLTKEGKIYLKKLNASKKFLKEYSLISKRNIKEEKLWSSYIRNAIFLNFKGKLDNDAKKYYEQIIEKYKYKETFKFKINKLITIVLFIIIFSPLSPFFVLLFYRAKNIDQAILQLILFNFTINPLIFAYFIKKKNPTAVK